MVIAGKEKTSFKHLLRDIETSLSTSLDSKKDTFYCLQPLYVPKKRGDLTLAEIRRWTTNDILHIYINFNLLIWEVDMW